MTAGIRDGLQTLLAGEATISALVGSRVYYGYGPQKSATYPHIVLTLQGAYGFNNFDTTNKLRAVDFDIDCKAKRSVESETLGDAVRTFIDDYTGLAGEQTISAVLMNDEQTDVEPAPDGSDVHVHNTLIDVTIQFKPV